MAQTKTYLRFLNRESNIINFKELIDRITFYIFRAFSWIFIRRNHPPYGLKPFILFILKHVLNYRTQVIQKNIDIVFPAMQSDEKKRIQTEFYNHFSNTIIEILYSYSYPKKILDHVEYSGFEEINELLSKGQSVIITGGHFYNWEWLGTSVFKVCPYEAFAIYKPLSNVYFDDYFKKARQENGMHLIPMKDTFRTMAKRMSEKKATLYIFASDQSPRSTKRAIWVDFFNRKTAFLAGMETLATKFDLPVFYTEFTSPKKGHYHGHASKLVYENNEITEAYANKLEESIEKTKSGWLWSHNRWKHDFDAEI